MQTNACLTFGARLWASSLASFSIARASVSDSKFVSFVQISNPWSSVLQNMQGPLTSCLNQLACQSYGIDKANTMSLLPGNRLQHLESDREGDQKFLWLKHWVIGMYISKTKRLLKFKASDSTPESSQEP